MCVMLVSYVTKRREIKKQNSPIGSCGHTPVILAIIHVQKTCIAELSVFFTAFSANGLIDLYTNVGAVLMDRWWLLRR